MPSRPPRNFDEWMHSIEQQVKAANRQSAAIKVQSIIGAAVETIHLGDLLDVITTTPDENAVLRFSSGGWIDGILDLSMVGKVNIATDPTVGTKALAFNLTTLVWEPTQVVADVAEQGTTATRRSRINFADPGFTVTDNLATDSVDVTTNFVESATVEHVDQGVTAPATPTVGDAWLDTSGASTVVKVWNGTTWA